MYHLQTLGELSVPNGAPGADILFENSKSLALVAYPAGQPRHRARRDHLAELFWPDSDRSRARQSLLQALYYLHKLHKKVGDRLVDARDDELGLRKEVLEVDLWALDRTLEAGAYRRVVELDWGPLLEPPRDRLGREFETWMEARNEHVWTGLKATLHHLVNHALSRDDTRETPHFGRRYDRLNPLAESARRLKVRALAKAGRPLEALQSYQRYRTLLAEELEDEPGPRPKELVEEIRERVFPVPSRDQAPGSRVAAGRASSPREGPGRLASAGRRCASPPGDGGGREPTLPGGVERRRR